MGCYSLPPLKESHPEIPKKHNFGLSMGNVSYSISQHFSIDKSSVMVPHFHRLISVNGSWITSDTLNFSLVVHDFFCFKPLNIDVSTTLGQFFRLLVIIFFDLMVLSVNSIPFLITHSLGNKLYFTWFIFLQGPCIHFSILVTPRLYTRRHVGWNLCELLKLFCHMLIHSMP